MMTCATCICFLMVDASIAMESCYQIGIRMGKCSYKSMMGKTCLAENNIALPERCKNKAETKEGIKKGIMLAKQETASSGNSNKLTLSQAKALVKPGKTKAEVLRLLGKPDKKKIVSGYDSWIYGTTGTTDDVAVVFSGGKVMVITYY